MKNNVKKTAQSVALALSLCFAQAAVSGAQEPRTKGTEFNATFTLQGGFGGQETKVIIPIDCDLLGPEGQKTLDFVKQFGIWGHIARENDIGSAERHLRIHGITPERIESVRQHCIENYL
jgi:hypothetical protein